MTIYRGFHVEAHFGQHKQLIAFPSWLAIYIHMDAIEKEYRLIVEYHQ